MLLVSSCGHQWQRKLAPCPDGIEGCCVAHYGDFEDDRYCPECGYDIKLDFKGPLMFHEEVGIAVFNTKAIEKIKIG